MLIDVSDLDEKMAYHLLMQSVIPRPVAWVLTDNQSFKGTGSQWNLAPFSLFQAICAEPPMVMISIGHGGREDRSHKDTWHNLDACPDMVIHVPHRELLDLVVASSATYDRGDSEVSALDLKLEDFPGSRLPRLAAAHVAFACSRDMMIEVGRGPQRIVFARVNHVYLDEAIAQFHDTKGERRLVIDPVSYDPVARLGGSNYATLGQLHVRKRPR